MKNILKFKNVSFGYKKNEVECGQIILESINLAVEEHTLAFLFGESGIGKSSLLRLCNGLESPISGNVFFHGENFKTLNPCRLRRKISLMQQVPVIFPGTIIENLDLAPGANKISLEEKRDILNTLGLKGNSLNKSAKELSLGQAQRVALARCLMNQPEILLLDEPASSLDHKNKLLLFETIMGYIGENKMTVLWVSHDQPLKEDHPSKKFLLKEKRVYEL